MHDYETTLLTLYFFALSVLCFYGLHRYLITRAYLRWSRRPHPLAPTLSETFTGELPRVLIQLPVFNERFVVERLITRVAALEYPHERLLIQVLDDSTDDSREIARVTVELYAARGLPIEYRHRTQRVGFKAGALDAGLRAQPHFDFITIFDSDFLPEPDFLLRTLPHFIEPQIGMVQARWGHLNRADSALTQAQAISLDSHFVIEHTTRYLEGRFFNFNGTAGVWRRLSIEDAGGWSHDTITEDLDLSYRAQLRGWRFVFLKDVIAPAELPIEINAFKSQQYRWSKGSVQVALKLLPKILKSDLPRLTKYEAFCHLTGNITYVMMFILALLHPLTLSLRSDTQWSAVLLIDLPILLIATGSVCFFFAQSQLTIYSKEGLRHLRYLPIVLGIGIGLTLNNAQAVLSAIFRRESPFIRTPKWSADRVKSSSTVAIKSSVYRVSRGILPYLELSLGLYHLYAISYCVRERIWFALPFTILFGWGFLYTAFLSFFQASLLRRRVEREARLVIGEVKSTEET